MPIYGSAYQPTGQSLRPIQNPNGICSSDRFVVATAVCVTYPFRAGPRLHRCGKVNAMAQVATEDPICVERAFDCTGCNVHLPLREAQKGERPQTWECVNCSTRHEAVFDFAAREKIWDNCRQVVDGPR